MKASIVQQPNKEAHSGTKSKPFFAQQAENSFFAESPQGTPFFSGIQTKLTVGQPGDQYEQEADAMAEHVMRMPLQAEHVPMISRLHTGNPLQRMCSDCEEEMQVQRVESSGGEGYASDHIASRLQSRQGQGSALPPATQAQMEQSFGTDFREVRIHTDAEAVQMSQDLNAQAFTHGSDIYFNQGKYDPVSSVGKRLLAHELTHTVQQNSSNVIRPTRITAESIYHQIAQDSIYETLAHEMVYAPIEREHLTESQVRRLGSLGFIPSRIIRGEFDFQMIGFTRTNDEIGRRRFPVIAFKGSRSIHDFIDDLNPQGIGYGQFNRNFQRIEELVERMGGRVDVTGHSLGGTLAQLYAIYNPPRVRRVITFQAPGLPPGLIDQLESFNQGASVDRRVQSTHYRGTSDPISSAGYSFTPGTVFEIPVELLQPFSVSPFGGHTDFPLMLLNRLREEYPELFRNFPIFQHSTARGEDARGFRPGEILRSWLSHFHPELEGIFSDDRVRDRIVGDTTYLSQLTFQQKVELIQILTNGLIRSDDDSDLNAILIIIRSMDSWGRHRILSPQFFNTLFSTLAPAARWEIGEACRRESEQITEETESSTRAESESLPEQLGTSASRETISSLRSGGCYGQSSVMIQNGRSLVNQSGTSVTPEDLRQVACLERGNAGIVFPRFRRVNVAVGRFIVNGIIQPPIAKRSETSLHSEDMVLIEANRLYGEGNYYLDAIFSERIPCERCQHNIIGFRNKTENFKVYYIITRNALMVTTLMNSYFGH